MRAYRIPSLTTAALLLTSGCGDEASGPVGGSTAGVNVTDARIDALRRANCEWFARCEPEFFSSYLEDIDSCVTMSEANAPWGSDVTPDNAPCVDALLDLSSCAQAGSCSESDAAFERKCGGLYETAYDLCPAAYFDAGSSPRRGLRIPR
jgi:hypothetical protein